MATYDRPWDIRLYIYPGANPQTDFTSWGLEEDVSAYVRRPGQDGGQAINYSGGRRSESAQGLGAVDYGELSCTVDNRDGRFSTDNRMGPYWPDLDLNTPLALMVRTGYDNFGRSAAGGLGTSDSGAAYTGASVAFTANGTNGLATMTAANTAARATMDGAGSADFDATYVCWRPVVSTGNVLFFGIIQYIDANNYMIAGVDFGLLGVMAAKIHHVVDGSFANLGSLDPIPSFTYTNNEKIRLRVRRIGASVGVKLWKDGSSEPGAWTLQATDGDIRTGEIGLYAWRTTGNTNANAVFNYDELSIYSVEFAGLLTELPVEWDMSGNNSWAPIKATGVLRRLRQKGLGLLASPLRNQLPYYGPTDYWPLEDGEDASVFSNVMSTTYPARPAGPGVMAPAGVSSLPGGTVQPLAGSGGAGIVAYASRGQGGTGFAAMFLAKVQTNPAAETLLARIQCPKGLVFKLELSINGAGNTIKLAGYQSDGTSVFTNSTTSGADVGGDWTKDWIGFCVKLEQTGANVQYTLLWVLNGKTSASFFAGTYASTIVPYANLFAIGGSAWEGLALAHMWMGPNTLPFVSYSFFNSFAGFNGETVTDRMERVALQAGIPMSVEADETDQLGVQPQGKALDILQSAADAVYGILYETGNGLGFRGRAVRRNQDVLTTLTMASGHLGAPPKPVRDDQRIRNRVQVSRTGGSSVTVEDTDSIDKHGEYEESASLNLYDDSTLPGQAGLRLAIGTRGGMRWTGLVLDFARNPSLLPTWRRRIYGPRIVVDLDVDSQIVGPDPDLIVEGWQASLSPESWTAELTSSDAKIWDTGIWDDPTAGRSVWGPTGATLNAAITSSATSIPVVAAGETWKTGAVTYTLEIEGEHIPISSVAGPVGGVYTLTASSRSANGVIKSHASGVAVTFANNARWGF